MNKINELDILLKIKETIGRMSGINSLVLDDQTKLVSDKIIDSFGVIQLILDLERQYSISFDEDDLLSDEFLTPQGLSFIVSTKISDKTILNLLKKYAVYIDVLKFDQDPDYKYLEKQVLKVLNPKNGNSKSNKEDTMVEEEKKAHKI